MKRTMTIALAVAVALSMTACAALDSILQVNILKGLAAIKADDIATADTDTLLEMSDSDSFYEALAGDEATKDATIAKIDDAIASADPDSADIQELSYLAATIELKTTPAGDLVNNIGGLMSDLIEGAAEPTQDDIEALFQSIVPDSVLGTDGVINEAEFLAMIDGLIAADGYFTTLGDNISGDVYASGTDFSAGDIAQSALVAAMVAAVEIPAAYLGSTNVGDYLYDLLTDSATPSPTAYTFPDMNTAGTPLYNILAAANISFAS